MNPICKKYLFCSVLIFCLSIDVFSQNCTDSKVKIKMIKTIDGTTIFGDYIKSNDTAVTLNSYSLGILDIPVYKIASNNDVLCSRIEDGEYWFENPSNNFYLTSPTSFSPGKNNFYFRNSFLFFNIIRS